MRYKGAVQRLATEMNKRWVRWSRRVLQEMASPHEYIGRESFI